MTGFLYSYLHVESKPEPLEKGAVDVVNVKQTASSMLTLCHILPLLLGKHVPVGNPYWINWLRLLRIVLLCTSTYVHVETAGLLRVLVAEYLYEFQCLYPRASFIPKMHYMVHLPDQMVKYGPLRHTWCMRFEGKNGFLRIRNGEIFAMCHIHWPAIISCTCFIDRQMVLAMQMRIFCMLVMWLSRVKNFYLQTGSKTMLILFQYSVDIV